MFLPSPPPPPPSYFCSRPIFRAGKTPKAPFLLRSLLHGNACYAGYFSKQNASLCDSPHPQGISAGSFPWYQLVARHLSFLPLPSMTEPPLTFGAPQGPPCRLSPAGRRKSFGPKSTPFSKIQTYIDLECQGDASSLHLLPQSVLHHRSGATAAKL